MTDAPIAARAADKLAAARTRLILDQPFLGALLLRLPLAAAGDWCRTTATDARRLYYNPRWIADLGAAEVQFALAHEALHCALGHFARRGRRVKRKWDLACDFAVNPLLVDEGLQPPAEAQLLDLYRGMTAEEIYPCIDDSLDRETLDEHAWDGDDGGEGGGGGEHDGEGDGAAPQRDPQAGGATPRRPDAGADADATTAPPPLSAAEREHLRQQWQRHLAAAAQRAREAGRLSGSLARLAETALAPQVSWRALLAGHLTQTARDDYSWQRPSRRSGEAGGDALFPALRSHAGDLCVALDTSGSIAAADFELFVGELNALKGTLPVRVTLLACDAALAPDAPWICEPWEELRLPREFAGGGGTAFAPVFEWIEKSGCQPDALVYFTDAEGEFPPMPPDYPVLWLVKGRAPVPWGRRIQLN